jgi:argininosuccinate lyase
VFTSPNYALRGCCEAQKALRLWTELVRTLVVNRERMLEIARMGYSGAPDLAIKLIREKDCGSRQAHRICCNAVRMARERGIRPREMTGALLDEAARVSGEPEPELSDAEVFDAMGLESFFEKHGNVGDPCPSETLRMIKLRRESLAGLRQAQTERRERVESANARLDAEIEAILKG